MVVFFGAYFMKRGILFPYTNETGAIFDQFKRKYFSKLKTVDGYVNHTQQRCRLGSEFIHKFSIIFHLLTALLDLFRAKYRVKFVSNKRTRCSGRRSLLWNGRLKGRGIYKIFSKTRWAFFEEELLKERGRL